VLEAFTASNLVERAFVAAPVCAVWRAARVAKPLCIWIMLSLRRACRILAASPSSKKGVTLSVGGPSLEPVRGNAWQLRWLLGSMEVRSRVIARCLRSCSGMLRTCCTGRAGLWYWCLRGAHLSDGSLRDTPGKAARGLDEKLLWVLAHAVGDGGAKKESESVDTSGSLPSGLPSPSRLKLGTCVCLLALRVCVVRGSAAAPALCELATRLCAQRKRTSKHVLSGGLKQRACLRACLGAVQHS